MKDYRISMKDYSNPSEEELEKWRRERQRESEGGRKGGKIGGPKGGRRSHKNE